MQGDHNFVISVPIEILYTLLDKICLTTDTYYMFSETSFRQMMYRDLFVDFANKIIPYYYESMRQYILRPMTYRHFLTIIRQICKVSNIPFRIFQNQGTIYHISIKR